MLPVLAALALLLSTHAPHARDVRVTATFHYEMQCGYPGSEPLVLHLQQHVPARLPRTAVLVNGNAARGVTVLGRRVTVQMPPRPQIMCDSIGPGTLRIAFTRGAHLVNPAAGRYRVVASKGAKRFSAAVTIR